MKNNKIKLFENMLTKELLKLAKGKLPEADARTAAKAATSVLKKSGTGVDLKKVPLTAKWILEAKIRTENGEFVLKDGEVYNTISQEVVKIPE